MLIPVALPVVVERLGVVLGPRVDDVVAAREGDGHAACPYLPHEPAASEEEKGGCDWEAEQAAQGGSTKTRLAGNEAGTEARA